MSGSRTLAFGRLAALAAVLLPALAAAQEWGFRPGGGARIEYNDNYFLTSANQQSATTVTVSPSIVGYRRSETSQVNLLAALGFNEVFGLEPDNDYVSGRLALDGSTVVERSTYGFNLSAVRDPSLTQSVTQQSGVALGRAVRDGVTVGASYAYELTQLWTAGTNASWYSNRYSNAQAGSTLQNNSGYSVSGNLGYKWSEPTQLSLGLSYSRFESDITESDYVTATVGVTHRYSEQLTVSANVGYVWSDIQTLQTGLACPTAPILCDQGLVARVPLTVGSERTDNGTLFGGSISYAFSERTSVSGSAAQNISPSGTGVITKTSNVGANLAHTFNERWRGLAFGGWTRTTFPTALSGSFSNDIYSAQASLSYSLTQAWVLEAGVRHVRAVYAQNATEPQANAVFVSIGYNWPGQSISDEWTGFAPFALPATAPGAGVPPQATPGTPLQNPAQAAPPFAAPAAGPSAPSAE